MYFSIIICNNVLFCTCICVELLVCVSYLGKGEQIWRSKELLVQRLITHKMKKIDLLPTKSQYQGIYIFPFCNTMKFMLHVNMLTIYS